MVFQSSIEASVSTRQLTRQCTCAIETESDSDNDSDVGRSVVNEVALENGSNIIGSSSPTPSKWPSSLSLLQHNATTHDPLKTSQTLHNAEALRQASALDNIFCSCYDVDTVLSTVQRRERGHFSPVQKLLLKSESIKQVFAYATSVGDMSASCREDEQHETDSNVQNPERYRQAFVATEMILRFYLKVMKWYGDPKQDRMENSGNVTDEEMEKVVEQETIPRQQSGQLTGQTVSSARSPTNMNLLTEFRSNASARKMARIQRLRASMRFESSGSSISGFSVSGDEDIELLEDPRTRGYLLRLEDLTAKEWKRIFGGLFRFLWPQLKSDGEEKGEDTDDEVEVDNILVANMCKITKNFVIFPGVFRLICDENESDEKESLLSRLAVHVYNPDIASLLHGLIHLSNRRGFEYFRIIRCLVQRIVEQVPTRLVRSLSSVSSTSTVSSTSSASPRSSIGGAPTIPSSSFFSSKTAPLFPSLFTSNTASTVHLRINGCSDILSKILKDEFPNTFRYYIQTKLQLASFESVEPFEREIFPPRMAPSDPAMHHKLKYAVLAALTENLTVFARLAELGMAELRFLDAHHMNGACIPRVLVIDILRQAIEFAMHDSEQVEAFVAPIHLVLDTVCASINYHQHLSTILEFAARDRFSDSDSDNDETEDGEDFALLARLSGKGSPNSKRDASPAQSTLFMGTTPPAISYSPKSGKTTVNHRPLASTLLVMHVVELLDVVILMSNDRIDSRLTRLDISTSLMEIFEKFPAASILHCRVVKLYLNLLNRPSTNGRVNNPLLRSIFRSPDSILDFILRKLDTNTSAHVYDAHLAIIGVKIAKICSSPTLQQELIRQFCNNVKGWNDFASSLVATHSQQMDVLDGSLLGLHVIASGPARNGDPRKRNTSEDDINTGFLLARLSSFASEYLSRELEPFRRLPMEKEGFGSSQNLARGNEAVHPSDMFKSRSQSKFPESIIDIMQSDKSTSFDVEEDDFFVSGYAYQKRSKWAKVYLNFDKSSCQLTLQDASIATSRPPSKGASKTSSSSKASFFQRFLMAPKQVWMSRPKTFVVCNARRWIVFHRGVKKQNSGAFGFQIEVFDGHREEDETLTFVTRSDASRTRWFESMQSAVTRTRTCNSFSDIDESANTTLVESVAKNCGGPYLVVPDVNLLGPMTSASFFLKSEVPEEMPFWGTYHGNQGVIKYASLFNQCLDVVFVEEKNIQAIGYSVIIEFDATFRRSESNGACVDLELPSVKCTCTDTYLISCNLIIGLTRTIADSEKLLQLLCDDE